MPCVSVKISSNYPSQNHFWLNGHRINTICPFSKIQKVSISGHCALINHCNIYNFCYIIKIEFSKGEIEPIHWWAIIELLLAWRRLNIDRSSSEYRWVSGGLLAILLNNIDILFFIYDAIYFDKVYGSLEAKLPHNIIWLPLYLTLGTMYLVVKDSPFFHLTKAASVYLWTQS